MSKQPEALRLADIIDSDFDPDWMAEEGYDQIAAELRRLHGEVAAMNQRADEIHKWYDVLLDRAEQAEAEVERLREALEDVIDPISKMERELEDGYNLDGAMAVSLSRDPEYLRSIARAALKETK
jgi:hypothetical protein